MASWGRCLVVQVSLFYFFSSADSGVRAAEALEQRTQQPRAGLLRLTLPLVFVAF